MKSGHYIIISIAVLLFGLSMWVEFHKPFRDLGVAGSDIPEYVCMALFLVGIATASLPFYGKEKRIKKSLLPIFTTSIAFGATAWIIERIFYFNYWKYGLGYYYLIGALAGGLFFISAIVVFKIIHKHTEQAHSANGLHASRSSRD